MKITKTELKEMIREAVQQALKQSTLKEDKNAYFYKKSNLETAIRELLSRSSSSFGYNVYVGSDMNLDDTSQEQVDIHSAEIFTGEDRVTAVEYYVVILPQIYLDDLTDQYDYEETLDGVFDEAFADGKIEGDPLCFLAYVNLSKKPEFVAFEHPAKKYISIVNETYNSIRELATKIVDSWRVGEEAFYTNH